MCFVIIMAYSTGFLPKCLQSVAESRHQIVADCKMYNFYEILPALHKQARKIQQTKPAKLIVNMHQNVTFTLILG